MKPKHKRNIAVVAAGLMVFGGAGATYAATKSSGNSEREAFLNDVAKRLKVDPKDLTTALREAFFDRLDAAVTAGKLSKDQADAIKKRITANGGNVPFGPFGGPGLGGGPGLRGGPPGSGHGHFAFGTLGDAAKFLGLTEAQLRDQLAGGKSLADVAKDKGKSVDDLKAAIKAATKSRLDDAVSNKKLTQAQEDEILKELDSGLDDIVNGKPGQGLGERKFRRFHGGGGSPPAFQGAPPAAPAAPSTGGGQI